MPITPLTDQHLEAIKDAQRVLADLVPLVANLEKCGKPCAKYKDKISEYYDVLNEFVMRFGPGGNYERGEV